jgi:signal transduction histidine kinase
MAASDDLGQRLGYLNLDVEDRELLQRLSPVLEKHADSFVAAFYRHLLSFGPTRDLLADPAVKDRLLQKQRAYLLSLSDPRFDAEYLAERRSIGEVHERVGLEPRWYLGAYALYFSLLTPLICDAFSSEPDHGVRAVTALQKVLTLDAQLAMEAYISASEKHLEYLTRELAEQSRNLARQYDDQSARLRRTTEEARAAEELASIATLVTGLAHEVGTPMGVIQGHAKMLESAVSGDDARWRLETIQTQISRISRIIQMLLGMARPRRSRRQPVAMKALVETTLSFVSEKMARRGIEVERRLESVPSVVGDSERLQQLLLNLLLNAADAMPDGGELTISLREQDGEIEIRVRDRGAGIPERDLDKIFDPFFTTKPAGEGNGLGLMVCKGIAMDHGGSIAVHSEEGRGTEFAVCLPLPTDPASPD